MTKYLAGVLSVIAMGVLLIAYGLLVPRVSAFDPRADVDPGSRSAYASEQMMLRDGAASSYRSVDRVAVPVYPPAAYSSAGYATAAPVYANSYAPAAAPQLVSSVQPVRAVSTAPISTRRSSALVERSRGRDWTKTA